MRIKLLYLTGIMILPSLGVFSQAPINPNTYLSKKHETMEERHLRMGETFLAPDNGGQEDSINVSILGVGGASAVQNLNQANAGVSFGFLIKYGGHKRRNSTSDYRLYQRNAFYLMFNPLPANSNDSGSIAKTFLFPELSKKDLVLGFERIFPFCGGSALTADNNEFRNTTFSLFTEFSTSHYDTGISKFRTWSGMVGCKLNFQGSISGLNFGIQAGPYYNLINVEPKYFDARDNALQTPGGVNGLPPTIHTIGFNVKASISAFEIFANAKYILSKKIDQDAAITNPDLKGAVFTVGVLINTAIWSFNIPQAPPIPDGTR